MEFLNNWKEKSHQRREEEVKVMANEFITLADFENKLYVAFQGNPLIVIDENLSASDILKKLQEIRNNYINSKLND